MLFFFFFSFGEGSIGRFDRIYEELGIYWDVFDRPGDLRGEILPLTPGIRPTNGGGDADLTDCQM